MVNTPQEQYRALLAAAELDPDPAQAMAVERLDRLAAMLAQWRPVGHGFFSGLLGRGKPPPMGLYIHGKVGRGKTMLMDLFFDHAPVKRKRRIHFHQFMAETHEMIAAARKTHDGDPLAMVAQQYTDATNLLCFDELHVTDIADAMILGRLFKSMFEQQTVVVATSNAQPQDLYKTGLNRQLFLPFIDLIEEHMEVLELVASKDFRLEKLAGRPLYFTPLGRAARAQMDEVWQGLTGGNSGTPTQLEVKGRQVEVPLSAMGVARFGFDDLCRKPLGAGDYLQIAHSFHTVMIDDIPILKPAARNEARRMINLIDTLYDNRISLVASAAAEPDALYPDGDGADLFERTASRLMEMRSESYLAEREKRHDKAAPLLSGS